MRTPHRYVCLLALSLTAATGFARADTIGRYQCGVIGTIAQEQIGDRNGHLLVSFEYSCLGVDGLFKDAVATAVSVSEWDGPKGTYLASLGLHRAPRRVRSWATLGGYRIPSDEGW